MKNVLLNQYIIFMHSFKRFLIFSELFISEEETILQRKTLFAVDFLLDAQSSIHNTQTAITVTIKEHQVKKDEV